jgi:hypothetical protein
MAVRLLFGVHETEVVNPVVNKQGQYKRLIKTTSLAFRGMPTKMAANTAVKNTMADKFTGHSKNLMKLRDKLSMLDRISRASNFYSDMVSPTLVPSLSHVKKDPMYDSNISSMFTTDMGLNKLPQTHATAMLVQSNDFHVLIHISLSFASIDDVPEMCTTFPPLISTLQGFSPSKDGLHARIFGNKFSESDARLISLGYQKSPIIVEDETSSTIPSGCTMNCADATTLLDEVPWGSFGRVDTLQSEIPEGFVPNPSVFFSDKDVEGSEMTVESVSTTNDGSKKLYTKAVIPTVSAYHQRFEPDNLTKSTNDFLKGSVVRLEITHKQSTTVRCRCLVEEVKHFSSKDDFITEINTNDLVVNSKIDFLCIPNSSIELEGGSLAAIPTELLAQQSWWHSCDLALRIGLRILSVQNDADYYISMFQSSQKMKDEKDTKMVAIAAGTTSHLSRFYAPPSSLPPMPFKYTQTYAGLYAPPPSLKPFPIGYMNDQSPYFKKKGSDITSLLKTKSTLGSLAAAYDNFGNAYFLPAGSKLPKPSGFTEKGYAFYSFFHLLSVTNLVLKDWSDFHHMTVMEGFLNDYICSVENTDMEFDSQHMQRVALLREMVAEFEYNIKVSFDGSYGCLEDSPNLIANQANIKAEFMSLLSKQMSAFVNTNMEGGSDSFDGRFLDMPLVAANLESEAHTCMKMVCSEKDADSNHHDDMISRFHGARVVSVNRDGTSKYTVLFDDGEVTYDVHESHLQRNNHALPQVNRVMASEPKNHPNEVSGMASTAQDVHDHKNIRISDEAHTQALHILKNKIQSMSMSSNKSSGALVAKFDELDRNRRGSLDKPTIHHLLRHFLTSKELPTEVSSSVTVLPFDAVLLDLCSSTAPC